MYYNAGKYKPAHQLIQSTIRLYPLVFNDETAGFNPVIYRYAAA